MKMENTEPTTITNNTNSKMDKYLWVKESKRVILWLFLTLIFVVSAKQIHAKYLNDQYQRLISEGDALFNTQYYLRAREKYEDASALKKAEIYPYQKQAEILELKKDYEQKIKLLKSGVENTKSAPILVETIIDTYLNHNLPQEAIQTLNQAPQTISNQLKIIQAYLLLGEVDSATEDFNKINQSDLSNNNNNLFETYNYYNIILKIVLEPQSLDEDDYINNLPEEVKSEILQIKKTLEKDNSTYRELLIAQNLIDLNFTNLAITKLDTILKNDPDYRDAYFLLGIAYLQNQQDYSKAVTSLEKTLEIDPTYAPAYFSLSQLYFNNDKIEQALSAITKATYLEKSNQTYLSYSAKIKASNNNCAEAISDQETVFYGLKKWQDDKTLYGNGVILIKYYTQCDLKDKALNLGTELMNNWKPGEKNSEYLELKELVLWNEWQENNDQPQSVTDYESFIEENPTQTMAYYHLGKIWKESGNKEKGTEYLQKAYEMDTNNLIQLDH